jgi:hypothetical protein
MAGEIRADPAYAVGFWDAAFGEPLFPDAAEPYRLGWIACQKLLGRVTPEEIEELNAAAEDCRQRGTP